MRFSDFSFEGLIDAQKVYEVQEETSQTKNDGSLPLKEP